MTDRGGDGQGGCFSIGDSGSFGSVISSSHDEAVVMVVVVVAPASVVVVVVVEIKMIKRIVMNKV